MYLVRMMIQSCWLAPVHRLRGGTTFFGAAELHGAAQNAMHGPALLSPQTADLPETASSRGSAGFRECGSCGTALPRPYQFLLSSHSVSLGAAVWAAA